MKSINHDKFQLNFWDLGGQKAIRDFWKFTFFCYYVIGKYYRNYFNQTDGIAFVIDSADDRRLEECGEELTRLLEEEKLSGVPLLIFSNKIDLATSWNESDISEALDLQSIRDRPWHIQPCSALKKTGLKEGMNWLVKQIK
jgi:ADP-ribosylation factor-like protein 3